MGLLGVAIGGTRLPVAIPYAGVMVLVPYAGLVPVDTVRPTRRTGLTSSRATPSAPSTPSSSNPPPTFPLGTCSAHTVGNGVAD